MGLKLGAILHFDVDILEVLIDWLLRYGPIILFFLLALGIVGLPIPDETLLFIAGWMICKGKLSFFYTYLASLGGSMFGISLSYLLGLKTGPWLIKKWGPKLRITQAKVDRVHNWYEKIGKWTLIIGYFVPVVRHLTGYVAGSTRLSKKQFMLFAYTGAFLWVTTFLVLGYFIRTELHALKAIK